MSRLKNRTFGGANWTPQAVLENGTVQTGQTATGANQAAAFPLTADITFFSTVAASTGARVPADLDAGDQLIVVNQGANALALYPPTGGVLNGAAANASVSIAAGKAAVIRGGNSLLAAVVVGA